MDVLCSPCDHVVLSHEQVSSLPSSLCLTDPQVITLNVFTSVFEHPIFANQMLICCHFLRFQMFIICKAISFQFLFVISSGSVLKVVPLIYVIVSDRLQNTSGDTDRDHFLSMELTHSILDFCSSSGTGTGARAGEEGRGRGMLKRNGSVLMKYLRGSDEKELTLRIQEMFQEHRVVKSKASRQESREVYLLCLKMRSR
jgi:23S rRNA U2552 (ribose-2'-O)-methylase RlmE/FtsJ